VKGVTPDARVLQFPPSATARPQDYGQFSRELSADELAGCFCFSDDDQRQIARRRRDVNRLGFAVQLGTVRYLGRFLENPAGAPEQVVAWTAREIGVAASTGLAGYGEGDWRWVTRPRSAAPTATGRSAPRESSPSSWSGCEHAPG